MIQCGNEVASGRLLAAAAGIVAPQARRLVRAAGAAPLHFSRVSAVIRLFTSSATCIASSRDVPSSR
jgi:hypothetical protein